MAGSHLAELILSTGQDCLVFGSKRWRSSRENIAHIESELQLLDCDLTDPFGCLELIKTAKPDFIFHLAAQSFVLESWRAPSSTFSDNLLMQLNIFEAVRRAGIDPVIQVALSSEEYGRVLPEELPIKETNPFRPLSPYAVSKVAQDMLAYQYWASYGLKTIRTRAFNHEGPRRGEVFVTSNFAKQVAQIELGLKAPVVHVGNLSAKRDWMDVRDVVKGYWLSVHHCVPGEDYVIAGGTSRSVREMLDTLLACTPARVEIAVDPARLRPSDIEDLQGDASKFKHATGWEPSYVFEQTMLDSLNYWRERLRGVQFTGKPSQSPFNAAPGLSPRCPLPASLT